MKWKTAIFCILISLLSIQAIAQSNDTVQPKKHKFWFYGGVGPNYYFNNLIISKDRVNSWNYSFAGRFMWEPGHLLSLGIETGYYQLYTVNYSGSSSVHITNTAIPIQLLVAMKFLKTYFFQFGMGQSVLHNKVNSSAYGNFDASSFSLGDFTGTLGHKFYLKNRLSVGSEIKFYYSSGNNDSNIALLLMAGYNF